VWQPWQHRRHHVRLQGYITLALLGMWMEEPWNKSPVVVFRYINGTTLTLGKEYQVRGEVGRSNWWDWTCEFLA
jgi:hypothetical protein